MPKVNDIGKQRHYDERISAYEAEIKTFLKKEARELTECRQNPQTAACKLFSLAAEELDVASKYLIINGMSTVVLDARNEDSLNEARKSVLKAIIYIENIVTSKLDALFSDYEAFLDELSPVSAENKLYFLRKMGLTIDLIKHAYGDNTKWKWAFVEIEGRFAVIVKNLLDFRKAQVNNLNSPDYAPISFHVKLAKKLLSKAADRFVERYELSTKSPEDMQMAVNYISALQRLKIMLNDKDDMTMLKKKAESWQAVVDGTHKNIDVASS